MRIAIDGRALQNGSWYQGIGTYSFNLIQTLMQMGSTHQLIPFGSHCRNGFDGSDGRESPFQDLVDRQGFRITHHRSFLDQLSTHRVDLCHVLEFIPPFGAADRTLATVYDLIPLVFPKVYLPWRRVRASWNLRAYYRFLRKVRQIAAVSHYTKADLVRFLGIPPHRIQVIYPGVNPAFRPLSQPGEIEPVLTKYRIPTPYVLYVGSCDYRKNVLGLMRAFAQFREGKLRDFHLVLVGKMKELHRKSLLKYGSTVGLTHHLHLIGYVSLKHLVALYNAATLLVYPSFYEGFGFPPLEAMACGTPVIASNTSSLPEVTDGAAVLVNPYNLDALAGAMHQVVEDQGLREALIQKGLIRAGRFSLERAAQETLAVYEGVGALTCQ